MDPRVGESDRFEHLSAAEVWGRNRSSSSIYQSAAAGVLKPSAPCAAGDKDIKASLRVDDAELGFLYGTAFAIFYSLFGIPLGRLADQWHRGRLIASGLAVWSLMTAASGLASSFAQLALARVGVGIGEASATPAAYSLLADHFPIRRRAVAISI